MSDLLARLRAEVAQRGAAAVPKNQSPPVASPQDLIQRLQAERINPPAIPPPVLYIPPPPVFIPPPSYQAPAPSKPNQRSCVMCGAPLADDHFLDECNDCVQIAIDQGGVPEIPPPPDFLPQPPPLPQDDRPLLDRLLASQGKTRADFAPQSILGQAIKRAGVQDSAEFRRIKAVPRRILNFDEVPDQTPKYIINAGPCDEYPNCPLCETGVVRLRPIQSAALYEAERENGLFAPIPAGKGKTLVGLLIHFAMQAKRTALLLPPRLLGQLLEVDAVRAAKHYRIPVIGEQLFPVSYTTLSVAKTADILDKIDPDLLVADEAHNLKNKRASRTIRVATRLREHPETRFVPESGTMTSKSVRDYQHLIEWSLHKNSSLPNNYGDLAEWADALDVSDDGDFLSPGILTQLYNEEESELSRRALSGDPKDRHYIQDAARAAYSRRLTETPGVISCPDAILGTSLIIEARTLRVPTEIKTALRKLKSAWAIGDEEIEDALALARYAKQLAQGFYYIWKWPDGIKDQEWIDARRAWHRAIRERLKHASKGMDSPLLLAHAADRWLNDFVNRRDMAVAAGQELTDELLTTLAQRAEGAGKWFAPEYIPWLRVRERYHPTPPTEAVWLSDFFTCDAVEWGREACSAKQGGIIWYESDAVGQAIAAAGGFPLFGGGEESERILTITPAEAPCIVASVRAHGEGKNLQRYSTNYVCCPGTDGKKWEQLLARTHRDGQKADEVTFIVPQHTDDYVAAFRGALESARYIQKTMGAPQRLLYGTKLGFQKG